MRAGHIPQLHGVVVLEAVCLNLNQLQSGFSDELSRLTLVQIVPQDASHTIVVSILDLVEKNPANLAEWLFEFTSLSALLQCQR